MTPTRDVGVLGEDVEDQRLPVDDVALEELLKVALLAGVERVVEDNEIDVQGPGQRGQLGCLSRADVGSRVDWRRFTSSRSTGSAPAVSVSSSNSSRLRSASNPVIPGKLDTDQEGALYRDLEVGDGCSEAAAAAGGAIVGH